MRAALLAFSRSADRGKRSSPLSMRASASVTDWISSSVKPSPRIASICSLVICGIQNILALGNLYHRTLCFHLLQNRANLLRGIICQSFIGTDNIRALGNNATAENVKDNRLQRLVFNLLCGGLAVLRCVLLVEKFDLVVNEVNHIRKFRHIAEMRAHKVEIILLRHLVCHLFLPLFFIFRGRGFPSPFCTFIISYYFAFVNRFYEKSFFLIAFFLLTRYARICTSISTSSSPVCDSEKSVSCIIYW